ncbi:MAG: DegT/DnrJ/EryC1/StrS family aminotransferase [Gammaproteobacteria bacterium]|nr:DegT/DnrJ/EryC1/StrS family aminotransferase [Gammaproteobacteria bacterium]
MISPVRKTGDFLTFGSPLIEEAEIQEVVACLRSGWVGTGSRVAQFEEDFAKLKGMDSAVAVNSCTAALHLSLLASGIGPGDEVITTPMTFCATVNAILHAGATPVLADVDQRTMNIDPVEIERRITKRTKAILPVHFAGRPCDMDAILDIARVHSLKVIEDCAHAIETEYKGRKAGTFGDFACFSFYSTKNIVTGEGGMILAKRAEDINRVKVLGLHGMSKDAWKRYGDEGFEHYQVVECGFKYNMMDLQAALGVHQLRRVDAYWDNRESVWKRYMHGLKGLPIELPSAIEAHTRHGYHLFTILVSEEEAGISRDEFLNRMTYHGIGVGVHYLSLPEHPYYQQALGWRSDDCPKAMAIGRQTVSLPISAKLTERDVEDVIRAVHGALGYE